MIIKNAKFYILHNNNVQDGMSCIEQIACDLATEYWRRWKRVIISCENEKQAIRMDDNLWIRPSKSFVPHNLTGEGTEKIGNPVIVSWGKNSSNDSRDILISLHTNFPKFSVYFTEVVDFVPCEEFLKQLARERYKAYSKAGFKISTEIWKYENNRKNIQSS